MAGTLSLQLQLPQSMADRAGREIEREREKQRVRGQDMCERYKKVSFVHSMHTRGALHMRHLGQQLLWHKKLTSADIILHAMTS